jgi:hypothetical protein
VTITEQTRFYTIGTRFCYKDNITSAAAAENSLYYLKAILLDNHDDQKEQEGLDFDSNTPNPTPGTMASTTDGAEGAAGHQSNQIGEQRNVNKQNKSRARRDASKKNRRRRNKQKGADGKKERNKRKPPTNEQKMDGVNDGVEWMDGWSRWIQSMEWMEGVDG